jgi:putative transcriptional regulator
MYKIALYRAAAGLSQHGFAKLLGVEKGSIQWYENELGIPGSELGRKIVSTFNDIGIQCTLDDVFPSSEGHEPLNTPASLGERVVRARSRAAMSQNELALKSKVSQPCISQLEKGRSSNSAHIAQIAKVLGVSAYWLATGEGLLVERSGETSSPGDLLATKLTPIEESALALFRSLSPSFQKMAVRVLAAMKD